MLFISWSASIQIQYSQYNKDTIMTKTENVLRMFFKVKKLAFQISTNIGLNQLY